MSGVFRNNVLPEIALDNIGFAAIQTVRSNPDDDGSYSRRMESADVRRGMYVAQRNMIQRGATVKAESVGSDIVIYGYIEGAQRNRNYMRTRMALSSHEALQAAKIINAWQMPDTPPISDSLIAAVRGNIEKLTNCISMGIVGFEEKSLYTELRGDFADFGLAGVRIEAAIPGDKYDPRVRLTFECDTTKLVSWFIWLIFDTIEPNVYERCASDCVALVKGLCNSSEPKTGFRLV